MPSDKQVWSNIGWKEYAVLFISEQHYPTGPTAILRKMYLSPFVPIRSVEAAVTRDVWSLSVVGIEKEKNVGIQTGVNHDRDSSKSIKNRTPRLRTPAHGKYLISIRINWHLPRLWDDSLSHELDDHEGSVGDEEHDDHGEGEVGGLLLGPGHVAHLSVTRKIHADRGSMVGCRLNFYSSKKWFLVSFSSIQ